MPSIPCISIYPVCLPLLALLSHCNSIFLSACLHYNCIGYVSILFSLSSFCILRPTYLLICLPVGLSSICGCTYMYLYDLFATVCLFVCLIMPVCFLQFPYLRVSICQSIRSTSSCLSISLRFQCMSVWLPLNRCLSVCLHVFPP